MILCVGDLAVDIIVHLERDTIDPTSDTPAQISQHRGGAAANVASVSARLGRRAQFAGVLVDDELGRWLGLRMAQLGIGIDAVPGRRTATIVVIVDPSGQRRFLTDSGDADTWPAFAPSTLSAVDRVYFTGYALCDERATDACIGLAKMAQAAGVPIAVDPSSVSVIRDFGVERFCALMHEIRPDLFLPNWEEHCQLESAGEWVPELTVVTRGAEPAVAMWSDGRRLSAPALDARVVDTTGAGDAFAGGFLAAFDAIGADHPDAPISQRVATAFQFGHHAAARVVCGAGSDHWSGEWIGSPPGEALG